MRRVPLFLLAFAVGLACSDTPTQPEPIADLVVSYGVEPSPFVAPDVNKLGAVAHHLEVIHDKLTSIADPSGGAIGKLGAMTNQLEAINIQVMAALDVVPDNQTPEFDRLREAALRVYAAAGGIIEDVRSKLGVEPTPFNDALTSVMAAAGAIQNSVVESGFCTSATGANGCTIDDAVTGAAG